MSLNHSLSERNIDSCNAFARAIKSAQLNPRVYPARGIVPQKKKVEKRGLSLPRHERERVVRRRERMLKALEAHLT